LKKLYLASIQLIQLPLFLQLLPYLSAGNYLPAFLTISRGRFDFCSARWTGHEYSGTAGCAEPSAGAIGMTAARTVYRLISRFNFMLCFTESSWTAQGGATRTITWVRRNYCSAFGTGISESGAACCAETEICRIFSVTICAFYSLLHPDLISLSSLSYLQTKVTILPYATLADKSRRMSLYGVFLYR